MFILHIVYILFEHLYMLACATVRKIKESITATEEWCTAGELFMSWFDKNPEVYVGLSEEGRMLLCRYLDAYDRYFETHPYIDASNHMNHYNMLVSLFFDFLSKVSWMW